MEQPIYRGSAGHVGHFSEPDPNSIYFEGEFFSTKAAPHPGVIKFEGLFVPPFVQFLFNSPRNFTVFGAWFSLLYETAAKLNCSLVGKGPNKGPLNEIWADLFSFRPDTFLAPLMPNNDNTLEALEMELATPSKMVMLLEMDHILSRKAWHHVNLMAMLTPFDFTSLVLMFVGLLFVSVLARYFKDCNKKSFQEIVWNLVTVLISPPEVVSKQAIWRFVGITWTLGVFLLQQLFSGDMFTAMTLPPDLNVIDTYEELATRTSMPISVLDSAEADGSRYLSPYREHRDELTKRLCVLPYEFAYNSSVIEGILANVSNGIQNHLAPKHVLEQYTDDYFDGSYKDKVYISSEFGQPLPAFIYLNFNADRLFRDAFDDVIERMQESGIYYQWVKAYLSFRSEGKKEIFGFEEAKAMNFVGLYVLCGGMLAIASVVLFVEMLAKKFEKEGSEAEGCLEEVSEFDGNDKETAIEESDTQLNDDIAIEVAAEMAHVEAITTDNNETDAVASTMPSSRRGAQNGCVARLDSLYQIETITLEY